MSTTPTQIRIDTNLKKEVTALFADLGLDLSSAVNIFLRQCVLHEGLPFSVERPSYSRSTLKAMREAHRIADDPNVPSYETVEELKKALEE